MDLNVSVDGAARARKPESAAAAAPGLLTNGSSEAVSQIQSHNQHLQNQRKRKPNRDSWPFMHAIMLLECFKDVWTKSNMGNLTMAQWTDVSNKVNEFCGISMNEQQCRTKVDNLKKRYKRERMKYAPTGHTSPWEFYGVMNKLFGNTTKLSAAGASPVSGQPAGGDPGGGEDTEGSDEDDNAVLDNGGDLIFNIPGGMSVNVVPSTSPGSGFGRAHALLLEGPGDSGMDTSPNENSSNPGADGYQDGGFSSASGLSPRKRMSRTSKRKRDGGGEGYGDLIKEVERERNADMQRRLVELVKVDKKRAKGLIRSTRMVDGTSAQQDEDEFDELIDRREQVKYTTLCEAEQKVELAAKALADAQEEKEQLERDVRSLKEASEYRKALAAALKPSFKKGFLEKILPPETINVSLNKFPYYLSDVTRDFLVEAVASCLEQPRRACLAGLSASSNTILLNGPKYSEMYQEVLVKAIAHDQGVALLTLDSTDLAPQDYGDEEEFHSANAGTNFTKSIFRKGDRVVSHGSRGDERQRRGRVVAVSENVPGKVGILFDAAPEETPKPRSEETRRAGLIEWHYASEFEKDEIGSTLFLAEWQASISALCEISKSAKPLIIYFPDVDRWFERAVPAAWKHEVLENLQKQFDKLNVVFIASFVSDEDDPIPMVSNWKKQRLKSVFSLFCNVVDIFPPQDDLEFWRWKMLLSQDSERVTANKNIQCLQKILISHNVTCTDFIDFQICEFLLTNSEAESVVSWATNYEHLNQNCNMEKSSSKFMLSAPSLERALLKLRRLKHAQGLKVVPKDEYEEAVLSTVISPNAGPKFEDVGGLDDVKKILGELVVLPLLRPEHFNKGALACPCKGVLLYGPPGTGKTLLTKAVATQSSANLFWLRGSYIEYKWLQDPKSMTRALFSIARKLAPSIIFLDEIDSIFGVHAGEAMSRFKFEFFYGWDRFLSRAGESVVLMAATYRPFDLDESVIQKFPRRLWMDLPDGSSREKILHVLLAKEAIENNFHYKGVAGLTEGYSGNDLKNLTVAAAYRPVREVLELEKNKGASYESMPLRRLTIQDFVSALEEVHVSYNAGYVDQLRQWGVNRW